jgi:hypothetical protein
MTELEIIDTEVRLPNTENYIIYTYRLTMDEKEAKYLKRLIETVHLEEEPDPYLVFLYESLKGVKVCY